MTKRGEWDEDRVKHIEHREGERENRSAVKESDFMGEYYFSGPLLINAIVFGNGSH